MKKAIIIITLYIVLCCHLVVARQLAIEDIKFYLNDERVKDVTYSGTIDAGKGDILKIKLDLFNNGNTTVEDIIFFSEIKDINGGSDVEKELTEFDLGDGDDITKELELKVPSDAETDDYPLYVKIRGIINNSVEELSLYNYTIDISEKPIDTTKILVDINTSLEDIKNTLSKNYVNSSLMSEVQELGAKKQQVEGLTTDVTNKNNEIEGLKTQIGEKDKNIETLTTDKNSLQNKIDNVLYPKATELESISSDLICGAVPTRQCVNQKIKDVKQSQTVVVWGVLIAAVIVFVVWKKKFEPKIKIAGQKPTLETVGVIDRMKMSR